MTVRWKPLLILSGLFVAVALVGVVAITVTLVPRSAQGILKRARAAPEAKRFADAEIYYKQVLQLEAKNAAVHRELAGMYREWSQSAPPAKKPGLRAERHGPSHERSQIRQDRQAGAARAARRRDERRPDPRFPVLGQGGLEARAQLTPTPILCWPSTRSRAERRTCPRLAAISRFSKNRRHRSCADCGSAPSSPMRPATRLPAAEAFAQAAAMSLPAGLPADRPHHLAAHHHAANS